MDEREFFDAGERRIAWSFVRFEWIRTGEPPTAGDQCKGADDIHQADSQQMPKDYEKRTSGHVTHL
ncbi:MAG: hypothetical protein ACJ8MH_04420 [Povalibacter sp.]